MPLAKKAHQPPKDEAEEDDKRNTEKKAGKKPVIHNFRRSTATVRKDQTSFLSVICIKIFF